MTDSNPWADQWLKAQQQFVSAWSDMAEQGKGQAPAGQADIWANGFDAWRKASSGSGQPDIQQALNKCVDMGKGYFTMAEQISKSVAGGATSTDAATQWFEQLKASMQQIAASMTPTQPSSWQMPGMQMPGMNPELFGMNASLPGIDQSFSGISEAMNSMSKMFSSPGLGYFRESQEKQQKGMQLALDFQQSNFKFNQASMQVSIKSLEAFQQQLTSMNSDEAPSSLRELYDSWVNVSEEHYAEFAMSEEYQALYGDMVNRLMLLKQHSSSVTDDLLEKMNLPTRTEVDTMQQRLQQTRRDNFELKKEIKQIKSLLEGLNSKPVVPAASAKKSVTAPAAKPKTSAVAPAASAKKSLAAPAAKPKASAAAPAAAKPKMASAAKKATTAKRAPVNKAKKPKSNPGVAS